MADVTALARFVAPAILALALTPACGDDRDEPLETPDAAPGSEDGGTGGTEADGGTGDAGNIYSDESNWLCLPGASNNVCRESLDATVLRAGGSTELEEHTPATDPPIDCFYVYPTVSMDESPNSDLDPGPEEIGTTQQQAARLSRVCEVYAPVYRQVTLGVLFGSVQADRNDEAIREIAYGDVLDAWEHYLESHNDGRGVVLIGHSQGAGILRRLIQEEIDGDAAMRERLVSAFLLGSAVAVPEGQDVGGSFDNVPACRQRSQTGCVVSYATFRATAPPPEDSFFGAPRMGDGVALCNNPAALSGGSATLTPYFPTDDTLITLDEVDVTTPYVTLPDYLEGECVSERGFNYLELTIQGDPSDPRPDDIGGDLTPQWGLHLVDAHVAMGDIVELAAEQAEAYGGR